MEIVCDDKATFIKYIYKSGERGEQTNGYYATTPNYDNCIYMISGVDGQYFLSIIYADSF